MFVTPKSIIKGDPNIVSLIKVNQSNPVGSVLGALDNTLLPLVSEKLSSLYRPTEADRYKPVGEFASLASKGITALPLRHSPSWTIQRLTWRVQDDRRGNAVMGKPKR